MYKRQDASSLTAAALLSRFESTASNNFINFNDPAYDEAYEAAAASADAVSYTHLGISWAAGIYSPTAICQTASPLSAIYRKDIGFLKKSSVSVSYTHLDVYKRQT